MSESLGLTKQQTKNLMKFISDNISMPVLGAGGGFAPIGTINFFDASVAPQGWLACDGSVHNISDYPELATFYASVHGASNFYGGDGTMTFAVPDLRGEFLRGTGTNSHENQGSGANVGVHQDGTAFNPGWSNNSIGGFSMSKTPSSDYTALINVEYPDKVYQKQRKGMIMSETLKTENYTGSENVDFNIMRPTNTSFLICIKATVAGDPNAHHYSTEEQVVAYDTDGSEIYEITFRNDDGFIFPLDISSLSASKLKKFDRVIGKNGVNQWDLSLLNASVDFYTGNNMSAIYVSSALGDLKITEITIQYTKTS